MNGWNDIVTPNTSKTYGFSLVWTPNSRVRLTQNYLIGPQMANTNSHWRNLTDTVVQFKVTPRLSLLENFDWGGGDTIPGVNSVFWTGIATYVRYAFNDLYAFAIRYEYYNDHNGFTTGTPKHINECTLRLERTFAHHLISRLEFRRDMSNASVFPGGTIFTKNQNTLETGLMYAFDIHGAR